MNLSQNDIGDGRLLILLFLAVTIISIPSISQRLSAFSNTKDALYLNTSDTYLYITKDNHQLNKASTSLEAAYPLLFQKIPINRASENLLETIPGVGSKTAALIVAERQQRGQYANANDLATIQGLGKSKTRNILKYITFE